MKAYFLKRWTAAPTGGCEAAQLHTDFEQEEQKMLYLGTLSWNSMGSWCQEGTYLLQTLQEDPKDHGVGQVSHSDGGTLGRHTRAA